LPEVPREGAPAPLLPLVLFLFETTIWDIGTKLGFLMVDAGHIREHP
jgi:hypothetical protein